MQYWFRIFKSSDLMAFAIWEAFFLQRKLGAGVLVLDLIVLQRDI